MKFILNDKRFRNLDPSIKKEITEKLYSAEKNISVLRSIVVGLNIIVYCFFLDKENTIEWLAKPIILAASLYSIFFIFFHPYKKYPLLLTSYFTSGTDALLITLWITATGGYESPFYPLWYVSILAVAMRYSMQVTLRTSVIYSILYFTIYWADNQFYILPHASDLIVRIGYLFLIAVTGGLMSQETLDQIESKIIIKKSEEKIAKRKQELKQAHAKLEERVNERTKELAASNMRLLRINEDIDQFVYSATHDLKSPLLNIEALINLLCDGQNFNSDHEKVLKEKIEKSIDRMRSTIHNLAEVAKSQKEVYDDIQTFTFEEVLYDVIAENEEIIKRENAQLEFNFDLARSITCSRMCIKSILYNFLTNSLKYRSPERSPIVHIRTEKENNYIVLYIKDNGLGMDLDKNRHKLFTIFKRFHNHVEGAGIGLYSVKKMVEKFNGDIDVESELGKGTTFKVRFRSCEEDAREVNHETYIS
jgi:signal transduction histidine kinase